MTLQTLIFSLDGTLAETGPVHLAAYNAVFEEIGLGWVWDREVFVRLPRHAGSMERIRAFAQEVGKEQSDKQIAALHDRKMQVYAALLGDGAGVELRSGVRSLIRDARDRGLKVGLATGTHRKSAEALSKACCGKSAVEVFNAVATGDEVPDKKPSPELYELVLGRLGVSADDAIAIEDSEDGVLSAKSTGMRVLATPSEFSGGDDVSGADWIVPSVERDNLPGYILRHVGMRPELSFIEELLAGAETA